MTVPPYKAHESCYIDDGCEIGEGTAIWHFTHVMSGARIGRGCNIGQNVVISPGVIVGDNVKIQNNVSVYTGVTLEDDVFCGPSMVFTNVINPRSHVSRKHEYQATLVKQGATIGVVTRDVPDFALVVGNPGRVVGWVCRCGVKLAGGSRVPQESVCRACGSAYRADGDSLAPDITKSQPPK
jgi:UDP-2-acetamido-3-amino-2,3-dideoxy-glucuronate N-acetyltransferase